MTSHRFTTQISSTLVALLTALLLAVSAAPAQAGEIVADSGFKVEPNGFSFANYGGEEGYKNLNSNQMRRLYGSAVCLTGKGSGCVLNPAARSWMQQMNTAMGGGHCYGFAALTWMMQRGQLARFGYPSLDTFGGGLNAFDLKIEGNPKLQSAIARAFVLQAMPSVINKMIEGTPTEILQALLTRLTPNNRETYTMTIFQPGFEAGHAITPISVEDQGDGEYGVHVYDNNWPGDDGRLLTIDTKTDTWSYLAATNPSRPGAVYRGDARTQTLRLMPTLPGLQIQDCSFCVGRKGANSRYNEVTLSSPGDEHAHLVITDEKGRQTGLIGDRLVNQIPGAKVMPRTAGGPQPDVTGAVTGPANSLEPTYLIPKHLTLKIKVDGSNLTQEDRESVNVVGPTFDSSVESIKVGPGRNAYLRLSPKKKTLAFTGAKVKSTPTVTFGAESEKAAYRIKVTAPGAPAGGTFFFAKKPNYGLLRIGAQSKRSQRYRVLINRYTAAGQNDFARSYSIRGKQEAYLYYAPLASPKGIARIAIGEPGKKRIRVMKVKPTD